MSTAAAKPASAKQLAFIEALAAEREVPQHSTNPIEAMRLERLLDVEGHKPVASREATDLIAWLKGLPRSKGASRSGPLYDLPVAKYCLQRNADATLHFFEVVERDGGARFVNKLIGAPGDWRRQPVAYVDLVAVVAAIARDPKAALLSFMEQAHVCARCLSPLSATTSLEVGVGPVCRKHLGL